MIAKASVNVAELRSRLSAYLKRVRHGEEILIRDRNLAVAKLVPLSGADDYEEGLLALAAGGLVRLPQKRLDLKSIFGMPSPEIAWDKLQATFEAEREES